MTSTPNDPMAIDRRTTIMATIADCVGQTPCVRLNRVPKMYGIECEVVAKCEFLNPGGSIKDRIGVRMIRDAEAAGRLRKGEAGQTLVEATSGNTGIGMSMAAASSGYNMVITMPYKMSHEKSVVLEALGAKVIRTPTAAAWDSPDSLIGVAKRLEKEEGMVRLDQYCNRSNPDAHYDGTGAEIVSQCGGKVDMVVIGTGTGGTLTGTARRIKEACPSCVVVGADPRGSILADPTAPAEKISYQVEGVGYDFVPDVCDRTVVDEWVKTEDASSFELARALHRYEGMLVGGSSGGILAAAFEAIKRRNLGPNDRVVVVFPDNIRNYLAKFVDDNWMIEKGFMTGKITRPTYESLQKQKEDLEARVKELEAQLQAKN